MQDLFKKVRMLLLRSSTAVSVIIFFIAGSPLYAKSADDLYRDGRFAEAEKAYQQGDMDNPRDIRYRYNRGCAAYQNKDYQGAEAAFTSVLRRAKDNDILYWAAYNLGNTAFVRDDFASAAEYYKQAIVYNPESAQAKYNLELSLKKLEEAEKNPENKDNKKGSEKGQNNGSQKGDSGKDRKDGKQDKAKNGNERDKNAAKDKSEPKDLSGDLSAENPADGKQGKDLSPAAVMERKKAGALLDNINEDRAKILEFQTPEEKKSTASGKNW